MAQCFPQDSVGIEILQGLCGSRAFGQSYGSALPVACANGNINILGCVGLGKLLG